MSEKPAPLWLHTYSGKESGLMVVGTSSSLKALGQQLLAAADLENQANNGSWPVKVANPEIVSPYEDVPDFNLSFHLQGPVPLETVVPRGRRNMSAVLFFVIATCALVGAFSIVRWVLAHAL